MALLASALWATATHGAAAEVKLKRIHPDYGRNGRFYVNYIRAGNDTVLLRFKGPKP